MKAALCILIENFFNGSLSFNFDRILLKDFNRLQLIVRATAGFVVASHTRRVNVLACCITEATFVGSLSAQSSLLPLHKDLPRAMTNIGTVLNLGDLLVFLLFLSDFSLLFDSLDEAELILHELVKVPALLNLSRLSRLKFG